MCNSSSSVLVHNRTSPSLLHAFVLYTTQLSIAIQHNGNSFLHLNIPRKRLRASSCIFQRSFLRGLSTEGNSRFKIDCARLINGKKFTVFALFYFVFEGNFQV